MISIADLNVPKKQLKQCSLIRKKIFFSTKLLWKEIVAAMNI